MKKIIALFLSFFMLFTIPGCGKSDKSKPDVNITSTEQVNLSQEVGEIYCADIDEEHVAATDGGVMYADNEILLVANENTSYEEINQLAESYQAEIVGWIEQTGDYQLKLSDVHTVDELESIAKNIQAETIVESACIDYILSYETDAVNYGEKWKNDLKDYEDLKGKSWGVEAICAPDAWNELEKNKDKVKPVRIGLIDNGFDTGHEDLGFAETFYNQNYMQYYHGLSDDDEKKEAAHGTHVAGTMAASADNNEGICGVYPYGKGNLYGASWKQSEKAYTENTISCIKEKCCIAELLLRNVKIINCSYGYVNINLYIEYNKFGKNLNYNIDIGEDYRKYIDNISTCLGSFLQRFIDKGYDFVITVAAGNQSDKNFTLKYDTILGDGSFTHIEEDIHTDVVDADRSSVYSAIKREDYPDVYDRIIVVGAVNANLKMTSYSNGGERVDVFAPGGDGKENSYKYGIFSTFPDNNYYGYDECYHGTSMAAPHVAGVAAMVWSANNSLKGDEVKKIVCDSGKMDESDQFESFLMETSGAHSLTYIEGNDATLVNAHKAVKVALGEETNSSSKSPQNGSIMCWVVDEENENNKIANANISVANTETGKTEETTTDENGHFELILPAGKYVLTIKADGYQEYHTSEIEVKNEEVTYPNWIKLKKQKTELSVYLKTDLLSFVELIGNMNRVDTSDGVPEYKNEAIIVSATPVPGYIDFINIRNTCDYTIHGMYYGMSFSEAVSLAEKDSISVSDDLPNYKYYCMRDGTQISIHANEENKLDGIAIFAEHSENELSPTPKLDNLIELAQKIYNSHTYTYDKKWDTTNYLYCIAETKKGLCLVVNEGGGLGSKIWVYDENGEMKINSESYAGTVLHFDGRYYDVFSNASGDGTRYIDMYYPDEHQYYENYEYNDDWEKINFSWILDNNPISKEAFEKIYQEYENNGIYNYQYKQGIIYYHHNGVCEEYPLKTDANTTNMDYTSAYQNFINDIIQNRKYTRSDGSQEENYIEEISYVYFDMNQDNIPELIINSGSCEANKSICFYTYKNNSVELIGWGFSGFHSYGFYKDKNTEQLVTKWGQMGSGGIYWYQYDNIKISYSREVNDIEYDELPDPDIAFNKYGDFEKLDYTWGFYSSLDNAWQWE